MFPLTVLRIKRVVDSTGGLEEAPHHTGAGLLPEQLKEIADG